MRYCFVILSIILLCSCSTTKGFRYGEYVHYDGNADFWRGSFYQLTINADSTYYYTYRTTTDSMFYQEFSLGRWSFSTKGRLVLQSSIEDMGRIPMTVEKSYNHNLADSVELVFDEDLDKNFWKVYINDKIYPIEKGRLTIPQRERLEYFFLLGYDKDYEQIRGFPNTFVKSEAYLFDNQNCNRYIVHLPAYASDFYILRYRPTLCQYRIKGKKLINQTNKAIQLHYIHVLK